MSVELFSHSGETLLPRSNMPPRLISLENCEPVFIEKVPQEPAVIRLLTTLDFLDINEAFRQAQALIKSESESLNSGTGNDYY